jgi:hypothetical protein
MSASRMRLADCEKAQTLLYRCQEALSNAQYGASHPANTHRVVDTQELTELAGAAHALNQFIAAFRGG